MLSSGFSYQNKETSEFKRETFGGNDLYILTTRSTECCEEFQCCSKKDQEIAFLQQQLAAAEQKINLLNSALSGLSKQHSENLRLKEEV